MCKKVKKTSGEADVGVQRFSGNAGADAELGGESARLDHSMERSELPRLCVPELARISVRKPFFGVHGNDQERSVVATLRGDAEALRQIAIRFYSRNLRHSGPARGVYPNLREDRLPVDCQAARFKSGAGNFHFARTLGNPPGLSHRHLALRCNSLSNSGMSYATP
jgi:hypothetical protein